MKKILSILLIVLGLSGCGKQYFVVDSRNCAVLSSWQWSENDCYIVLANIQLENAFYSEHPEYLQCVSN